MSRSATAWCCCALALTLLGACHRAAAGADPHLMAGDGALRSGHLPEAVAQYQLALHGPARKTAALRLAEIDETLERWSNVESLLAQAKPAEPSPLIDLALARAKAAHGRFDEGFALAEAWTEPGPFQVDALLHAAAMATQLSAAQRIERALVEWHHAHIGPSPDGARASKESFFVLAALHERLGRSEVLHDDLAGAGTAQLHDPILATRLALVILRVGQATAAQRLLRAVLDRDSGDGRVGLLFARTALAARDATSALAALDAIPHAARLEPETTLLHAEALAAKGDATAAVAELRGMVASSLLHDASARARVLLRIAALSIAFDAAAAEGALQEAAALHTADHAAELALADLHMRRGETSEALVILQGVGNIAAVHYPLARVLAVRGELDQARREIEAALAPDPAQAMFLQEWLSIMAKREASAAALASIDAWLEQHPHSAALHAAKGDLLRAAARLDEASLAYATATEEAPRDAALWAKRGDLSAQRGQVAQASDCYRHALESDPNRADVAMAVAQLRLDAGDRDAARAGYEAILARQPNYVPALNNLALLLVDLPREQLRARRLAELAHVQAPKASNITDSLAWVRLRSGDAQGALELLSSISDDASATPEILEHYAAALDAVGRTREARDARRRAQGIQVGSAHR